MPAITKKARRVFDAEATYLGKQADCAGDLQYIFSVILENYIETRGLRYQQLNDVMGALSGAEKEFFEHVVSPYEMIARKKNGAYYMKTRKMLNTLFDQSMRVENEDEDKKETRLYDPPAGWKYGFPKPYRPLKGETLEQTLLRDGYPQIEIDNAGAKYCRFIEN